MKFILDINTAKYEGRTPAWIAKELFVVLENECVEVLDVKWLGDVKPKVVRWRVENDKPIFTIEI